ncbi:MAG TPA: CrcB family protein [Acidimicrobiales bacterium]|jgi:CrcB protein
MDDGPHQIPDDVHAASANGRRVRPEKDERDLLYEPVVPPLGLSTGTLAAVFIGGALGTVARYLLEAHHPVAPGAFPWVTLLVNLTGSLAIGFLIPLTEPVAARVPLVRAAAIVGFLGGWTTYSTLAVDATLLAKDGDVASCVAYLAATVVGGLALVVVGHAAGRRLAPS